MTFTLSRRTLLIIGFVLVFGAGIGVGVAISEDTDDATTAAGRSEGKVASQADSGQGEVTEVETQPEESESGSEEDCEEAGISVEPRNEGVCAEDGVTYVVVNERHKLKLKELEVRLLGIQETGSVSSSYGETKTANGTYVLFTLEVTNRLHEPASFDANQEQTALYIDGNTYTEDFEAENYGLEDSFLELESIQPQGTETGTIAFDVPDKVLSKLTKSGNLDIVNFSEESSSNPREVGTIRTYQ